MVDLPVPGRSDQHVEAPPRGGDLLYGQRLVEAEPEVPAGQIDPGHRGQRAHGRGRTVDLAPGLE